MRLFGFDITAKKVEGAVAVSARRLPASRASTAWPPRRLSAFRAAETDSINHSWTKTPVPINTQLEERLQILRARSRDVGLNTDHGAAFLRLCRDNIVGAEGMQLRVMAAYPDGKLDERANMRTREAWNEWSAQEHCSMGRELAMVDLQRAAITALAEDGEAFFRIVTGSAAGREWPIALHQIDSEMCPVSYNQEYIGGRRVRMGIERDEWGRPIAYYFYKILPGSNYQSLATKQSLVRIPASEIIHLYVPERAGQGRGVPWLAPGVQRVKMLAAYDEAALVAARAGANKVGVITTPDGEGWAATSDTTALQDQEDTGVMVIDSPDPGAWIRLASGETVNSWNPDYPRGEYDSFTSACLRGISSGLGVGYQSLSMDRKGASYSSGRLETQQERETWKALQGVFSRKFCRRVYLEWLPIALMAQKIRVGDSPLPLEREAKLSQHRWQGRRWEWVDPDGDMSSKQAAVQLGITTVAEIIRETGRDPDEVFRERRQELQDNPDILGGAPPAAAGDQSASREMARLRRAIKRDSDQ